MKAFKNDNIIDKLCGGCDCNDFAPSVSFDYDADAKTIDVTDATTWGTGVGIKIIHIGVYDRNGEKVLGSITDAGGTETLNVSTLDASGGFAITATVVSDAGCISDGHAEAVGIAVTAGDFGWWDKDNDKGTIGEAQTGS